MVEVVCKESGITFEASSKRTQQHPRIAALKQQGNKDGTYREVNDALMKVKKAGGYTTIDEFMALVEDFMNGKKQERRTADARIAEQRAKDRADDEARKEERRKQNELLKANGYTWNKYTRYDETQEEDGFEWVLKSADGREVSVTQALAEIERGVETVKAEIETAKQLEQAKQEAERAAKQRQEDADTAAYAAFDELVEEVKQASKIVEPFDYKGFLETAKMGKVSGTYRRHDRIYTGEINGIMCYVTFTRSGYDDDGYPTYYCEDPEKAGVELLKADDTPNTFSMFF